MTTKGLSRMRYTTLLSAALLGMLAAGSFPAMAAKDAAKAPEAKAAKIEGEAADTDRLVLDPSDEDVLLLKATDKGTVNLYVTEQIPINQVEPIEIRNIARGLTAKEGGRAEVIRDKEKKQQSYVQVIAPKWQIPFLRDAIAVLDKPWLREYDDGGATGVYRPKHRWAGTIDAFASHFGGDGFSTLDGNNNAAIRFDDPYRLEQYVAGATAVDIPEHQARFTVKVYEVNTSNDTKLGLDYVAWKNGPGRNLFGIGSAGYWGRNRYHNNAPLFSPFGTRDNTAGRVTNYRDQENFAYANFLVTAAYVDFLASKGKAKTLAEGSVQVRSGDTGTFSVADQVVTFVARTPNQNTPEGDSGTPTDGNEHVKDYGRTLNKENAGEVGISIDITPVILTKAVEASVVASVSTVAGYTPNGLPIINSTATDTKARLKDGGVLVLSGLKRNEKTESKAGAPGLSNLPVLGYLFGGENNINRDSEIIVVIECKSETGGASILENPTEVNTIAAQVSGEAIPEVPKNNFGFDQWLLGSKSGSNL